jgi:hypothetical protein
MRNMLMSRASEAVGAIRRTLGKERGALSIEYVGVVIVVVTMIVLILGTDVLQSIGTVFETRANEVLEFEGGPGGGGGNPNPNPPRAT